MSNRRYPRLVGSRFSEQERAALELAAQIEALTLNEFVRRAVLPAVRRTLDRSLDDVTSGGGST